MFLSTLFNDAVKWKGYRSSVIDEWRIMKHWGWQWREYRHTRRKHFTVTLSPPEIPYGLAWEWTRASTVRSRQLTAWAMTRHTWQCVSHRLPLHAVRRLLWEGSTSVELMKRDTKNNVQSLSWLTRQGRRNMSWYVICSLVQLNVWLVTSKILRQHLQYIEFYMFVLLCSIWRLCISFAGYAASNDTLWVISVSNWQDDG